MSSCKSPSLVMTPGESQGSLFQTDFKINYLGRLVLRRSYARQWIQRMVGSRTLLRVLRGVYRCGCGIVCTKHTVQLLPQRSKGHSLK